MEGVAGPPLEGGDAAHPTPNMATREQPPSKRRRVGVVWDESNLAKHSAERLTPDHATEEHVFYVDTSEEADISAAADTLRLDDSVAPAVLPPQIGPGSDARGEGDSDEPEVAALPDPVSSVDAAEAGGVAPPAVVPVPLPPVVPGSAHADAASDSGVGDGGGGNDDGDGDGDGSGDDSTAGGAGSRRAAGAPPQIGGGAVAGGVVGGGGAAGRPVSKFAEMRRKHYDERQRLEDFRRRAEVEDDSEDESGDDEERDRAVRGGAEKAAPGMSRPDSGASR